MHKKSSKLKVYIETSVISYLASRPSTNVLVLAKQHVTVMWWQKILPRVDAHISPFVLEEVSRGDRTAAAERLKICRTLIALDDVPEIADLAKQYIQETNIPNRAEADAFHIACATLHKMDFLMTWNCTHIANAFVRRKIEKINQKNGYDTPVICMPEELWEE